MGRVFETADAGVVYVLNLFTQIVKAVVYKEIPNSYKMFLTTFDYSSYKSDNNRKSNINVKNNYLRIMYLYLQPIHSGGRVK